MEQVRIFALGGLDEDGKNMFVVEVDDSIILIEAGIKFPEAGQLGVEFIIPDFTYLIENADRIKGIFITHGHDDVSAALPYLLKQVNIPVYTGALTANVLRDTLKKEGVKDFKINKVKRTGKVKLGNVNVRTFAMTHAYPDNFGVAIETSQGYVVYTGEFIVDYDLIGKEYNFDAMHDYLYERGFTIYPGKVSIYNTFRVANIGAIDKNDISNFLAVLEEYLKNIKYI